MLIMAVETGIAWMTFSGWGQPPDPLIVPVVLGFWGVGIPTVGSCAGHRGSATFVAVRPDVTPWGERHWEICQFLALHTVWPAGCTVTIASDNMTIQYSPLATMDEAFFTDCQQAALTQWRVLLQELATILSATAETWHPWTPPTIPPALDLEAFYRSVRDTSWYTFWNHEPDLVRRVAVDVWNGYTWSQIATRHGIASDVAKASWQRLWAAWQDLQTAQNR